MTLKYLVSMLSLFLFISCSNKTNLKDEMVLKTLPTNSITSLEVVNTLKNYAANINKIDYNEILSHLKDEVEEDNFKKQMIDLKIAYEKCVDKVNEVENASDKDKSLKMAELNQLKDELDTVWMYIVHNFRI